MTLTKFSSASFASALLVALSLFSSNPVVAQQNGTCVAADISESPIVAAIVEALDAGNYDKVVHQLDVDNTWSETQQTSLAENLDYVYKRGNIYSCTLLQRRHFSDDFYSEVFLFEMEQKNLHMYIAYIQLDSGWRIVRIQLESSFDEILTYLR